MAVIHTDQGDFEVCDCGNPDSHVGAVWHPGFEHPSGAVEVPADPTPVSQE